MKKLKIFFILILLSVTHIYAINYSRIYIGKLSYLPLNSNPNEVSVGSNADYRDFLFDVEVPSYIVYQNKNYLVSEVDGFNNQYNRYTVTSIKLPPTIKKIDNYAFYGCSSLKSINIPDAVEKIGYNAFDQCFALEEIVISAKVVELGKSMFSECRLMRSVTLLGQVKFIGCEAFYRCSQLKVIKVYAATPPYCCANAFDNYNCTLYVPASSVDKYKSAFPWRNFSKILPLP